MHVILDQAMTTFMSIAMRKVLVKFWEILYPPQKNGNILEKCNAIPPTFFRTIFN